MLIVLKFNRHHHLYLKNYYLSPKIKIVLKLIFSALAESWLPNLGEILAAKAWH